MKPNHFDHDDALKLCQKYRALLTDREFSGLNQIAAAYACDDHASGRDIKPAMAALSALRYSDRFQPAA